MKNVNIPTIVIICVLVSIGAYFVISMQIRKTYTPTYEKADEFTTQSVGVNEYKVVNVNTDDIVNMYFNTFMTLALEEPDKAYQKLDDIFRENRFPKLESFRSWIETLSDNYNSIPEVDKYDITSEDGMKVIRISDNKGNIFLFKIEAVMKYSVTIE